MAEAGVIWSCAFTPMEKPLKEFTVGTLYTLDCHGPDIQPLQTSAQFSFVKEEDAYTLHVLKVMESQAGHAKLLVTSYKPGEYKPEAVFLSDGQSKVEVRNLEWTVNSVVQGQMSQPEPFGPMGPWEMSYPWWVWASLAATILIGALVTLRFVSRRRARKRLLERLRSSAPAISPYNQFHRELRGLMRKRQNLKSAHEYVENLNNSFRAYLTCELLVPAQEWGDSAVLSEIKRRHKRLYKESSASVRALLAELERARGSKSLSVTDCEQLHDMSRKVVDEINIQRQQESR